MNDNEQPRMQETALAVVSRVLDAGIGGIGPLKSSVDLAAEYLSDLRYRDGEHRVDSLINWETSKNFTTGFLSGLGGFAAMAVSVPAGLGTAWLIQARLVGTVATIYGHDVDSDRVRTLALLSMAGDAGKEVVKRMGIDLSNRAGRAAIGKVSGRTLIEINKRVGFRLLTKAGSTGVINLSRGIPILGGVVAGSIDATALRLVGRSARLNFRPDTIDA
jgi:hypothetical protein